MGAAGRVDAGVRHALSIESQLLAIGSGFVVLIAVAAIFVTLQQRRQRRNGSIGRDFHSPLLVQSTFAGKPNKYRASSRTFGSPSESGSTPPPIVSPNGSSSGSSSSSSPQCTPLTSYASFGIPTIEQPATNLYGSNAQVSLDTRGSLSLALNYDESAKILQITVIACHNLPEIYPNQNEQSALNPYVKLRILPDNQHRVKTRVLRGTCNPFYDEQFTLYGITREQLQTYTLHLAVLAFDRYSHDTVLGESFVGLVEALTRRNRDLNDNENAESIELTLYPRPAYNDLRAQILLSIAYNQLTNSVNLAVLKMKDLPCDEKIGQIDPYVKVYMLINGQRVHKQKTHVKKRCTDPVFNAGLHFNLEPSIVAHRGLRSAEQILDTLSFEIQVLNHSGVTRNELVGQCLLGNESKHWQAVREQPGQQIAEWHRVHQSI